MKSRFRVLVYGILGLGSVWSTFAQTTEPVTIVTEIEKNGVILIEQPASLANRLVNVNPGTKEDESNLTSAPSIASESSESATNISDNDAATVTGPTVKTAGYRVQVFSDNNVRTAKSEARAKAQAISTRLPQYRTYVAYNSPFWRLRVGDFPTLSEAENAADEIKKLFPAYASEVRVVKDRINR